MSNQARDKRQQVFPRFNSSKQLFYQKKLPSQKPSQGNKKQRRRSERPDSDLTGILALYERKNSPNQNSDFGRVLRTKYNLKNRQRFFEGSMEAPKQALPARRLAIQPRDCDTSLQAPSYNGQSLNLTGAIFNQDLSPLTTRQGLSMGLNANNIITGNHLLHSPSLPHDRIQEHEEDQRSTPGKSSSANQIPLRQTRRQKMLTIHEMSNLDLHPDARVVGPSQKPSFKKGLTLPVSPRELTPIRINEEYTRKPSKLTIQTMTTSGMTNPIVSCQLAPNRFGNHRIIGSHQIVQNQSLDEVSSLESDPESSNESHPQDTIQRSSQGFTNHPSSQQKAPLEDKSVRTMRLEKAHVSAEDLSEESSEESGSLSSSSHSPINELNSSIDPSAFEALKQLDLNSPQVLARKVFDEHLQAYLANAAKQATRSRRRVDEIKEVSSYLCKHKIPCVKFNHSLQKEVQVASQFRGYIQLTEDEACLSVFIEKKSGLTGQKYEVQSSTSCMVADIESIIFGGFSSRFWMMRKTNNVSVSNQPFYAWQCLTLETNERCIDLMIPDEDHMEIVLKFLIYKLKTVDGTRGSAEPVIRTISAKMKESDTSRVTFNSKFATGACYQVRMEQAMATVMEQTWARYRLMRTRCKISYSAFSKNQTIPELIYRQILITLRAAKKAGIETCDLDEEQKFEQLFPPKPSKLTLESKFLILGQFVQELAKNSSEKFDSRVRPKVDGCQLYLKRLMNKENVLDLFKDVKNDQSAHGSFLRFKWIITSREIILKRLRLMLGLKLMGKALLLKGYLKRIETNKEIFTAKIEQGGPVKLPKDLSQEELPLSFRYYDSILQLLDFRLSDEKKDYVRLKQGMNRRISKQLSSQMLTNLVKDLQKKPSSRTIIPVEELTRNHHMREVQQSNYLQINYDLNSKAEDKETRKIQMKFCTQGDVESSEKEFLKFRATFTSKQSCLKSLGKQQDMMKKVNGWLEELRTEKWAGSDYSKWEDFERIIHERAWQLISERKQRQRKKYIQSLKEILLSSTDLELKSNLINHRLEASLKYMSARSLEEEKEMNNILSDFKKTNLKLKQQNK